MKLKPEIALYVVSVVCCFTVVYTYGISVTTRLDYDQHGTLYRGGKLTY